jgi:tRNA (adenine22-N1)-methyltransferase
LEQLRQIADGEARNNLERMLNPLKSERLAAIAGYVTKHAGVADIGTDHGYLPVWLVENDICPFAVLTDQKEGPLRNAWRNVASSVGTDAGNGAPWLGARFGGYEIRLGDGLLPLAPGEVDTVVIAGMGGETIRSILDKDRNKSGSFPKYVLQPRTNSAAVRAWIRDAEWYVIHEDIAEENGKLCEIVVCAPDPDSKKLPENEKALAARYRIREADLMEMEVSGVLLRDAPPLLRDFLGRRIEREQKVIEGTAKSAHRAARQKRQKSEAKMLRLEEMLQNAKG